DSTRPAPAALVPAPAAPAPVTAVPEPAPAQRSPATAQYSRSTTTAPSTSPGSTARLPGCTSLPQSYKPSSPHRNLSARSHPLSVTTPVASTDSSRRPAALSTP